MPTSPPDSRESHTAVDGEAASTRLIKMPTTNGRTKTIPDREYRGDGVVVVRMLFGSWAHGTQHQGSDEDWRGVFQLPNDAFLGLRQPKTTYEAKPDQVYHELGHYMRLLMKGNPNIIGMLFAPDDVIFESSGTWRDLVTHREAFISRSMANAYRGWLYGELLAAEKNPDKFPQKRLAHIPRLAYELYDAVIHRYIGVRQSGVRLDFIMAVKEGRAGLISVKYEFEEVMEAIEPHIDRMPEAPEEMTQRLLLDYRGM